MTTDRSVPAAEASRLLAENERIFREAQAAADTVFAHYQLSQILASHEAPAALSGAILDELMHLCGADCGALWIYDPRSDRPVLAAQRGAAELAMLGDDDPSSTRVTLDDSHRPVGIVALQRSGGRPLEPDGVQFVSHVRHELAVSLRGAQLREALDLERAELGAVFEGAGDAIVLVDEDRRVVRVNAVGGALLGVEPAAAVGRLCEEVLACKAGPGPGPCDDVCPFAQVLATGEAINGLERGLGSDALDPVRVVGSYALASRSAGGAAMAVAVLRDTTQLAHLQELRRGFIATVSHELRTPLALIKGYVDTLLNLDLDAATTRRYLQRIDETTDRLSQLVRQTLDVTQLAIGQLVIERSPVLLADLLHGAAEDLRRQQPQMAVEVVTDEHLPVIDVDASRLRQVLDNLLANASKYGPATGPVRVHANRSEGSVVITVEDEGQGVPAEERELVFEQFHRGRTFRESTISGYGLGLSISRRIIEAHGGQLHLETAASGGTRAVIWLPVAQARLAALDPR